MLNRTVFKYAIAVLIFTAGMVVIVRALNRPGVKRALDGAAFDPPGLLALRDIDFDSRFTASGKHRVFETIATRIAESIQEDGRLAAAIDGSQRDRLAAAFVRQLDMSIFGTCEQWLEAVAAADAAPRHAYFGSVGDGITTDRFCELWELAQSQISGASVAAKQAFVRPFTLNGEQIEWESPPQVISTRFIRDYASRPPRSLTVECILPVAMRLGDRPESDWIVQMSIMFDWDASIGDWLPIDLLLYSNLSRSGTFVAPPL